MGELFAAAYKQNAGPSLHTIFAVKDRSDLQFSLLSKILMARKMLGVRGLWQRLRQKMKKISWIESLQFPSTNLYFVEDANDLKTQNILMADNFDLLISIGAPRIITFNTLKLVRLGGINVHNGKLPVYRGHFGTFWEVLEGEPLHFTTIHRMVPKVDAGEILAEGISDRKEFRSFFDLMKHKKSEGGKLLAEVLNQIESTQRFSPLPVSEFRQTQYFGWPNHKDVLRFNWNYVRTQSAAAQRA